MDVQQPPPQDQRRDRRAERLRRAYDALGREQNGIFESLAEYTHEVQAEVRALEIARDRLSAKRLSNAGGSGDTSPGGGGGAVLRVGRPLVLGEWWISWEAAAASVVICGVLGMMLGMLVARVGGGGVGALPKKSKRGCPHQD